MNDPNPYEEQPDDDEPGDELIDYSAVRVSFAGTSTTCDGAFSFEYLPPA